MWISGKLDKSHAEERHYHEKTMPSSPPDKRSKIMPRVGGRACANLSRILVGICIGIHAE